MEHLDRSPITDQPVTASMEWTDREAHQRFRVEYDDAAARFCVRTAGEWELLQEATRLGTGSKFDLAGAHEHFRTELRGLQRMEREGLPMVVVDDPVDELRQSRKARRARA